MKVIYSKESTINARHVECISRESDEYGNRPTIDFHLASGMVVELSFKTNEERDERLAAVQDFLESNDDRPFIYAYLQDGWCREIRRKTTNQSS